MDDSPRVILVTAAEERVNRYGSPSRPSLIIRCQEKATELYIVADDYLGMDTTQVAARIDDSKPATSTWDISTDSKGMFARGAIPLIRKLVGKTSYTVRFTPYNESPVTLKFDVRGLAGHLPKVAQACGWKP